MIKARKELGIKGFCAINGAQESTSTWCARASGSDELEVQTDKQTTLSGSTMACLGEASMSDHWCGETCIVAGADASNIGKKQKKQKKVANQVPCRRIWIGKQKENESDVAVHPESELSRKTNRKGRIMGYGGACRMPSRRASGMDYGGACRMSSTGVGFGGACSMTQLDGYGSSPVGKQDGDNKLGEADLNKDDKHEKIIAKFLQVGTQMVWNEVKDLHVSHLFGGKWRQYMVKQIFMLDYVYKLLCSSYREGTGDMCLWNEKMQDSIFENLVDRLEQEVQIRFFMKQQGLCGEKDMDEEKTEGREAALPNCAPGNTEDVPRDTGTVTQAAEAARGDQHEAGRSLSNAAGEKETRMAMQGASEALGSLRGGMAGNQFEVLREEDEEETEEVGSIECQSEHGTAETEDSAQHGEADEVLDNSMSSGRSYYAEHYQRKAGMQGGAGGASTTQNRKLTSALDALAEVVKSMGSTQHEAEEDSPEAVIGQIIKLVQEWKEKTPTRSDMRAQLRRLHVLLEQDCRRQADPAASREADPQQPKQSFYGEFVQRVREAQPTEGWKTKGSGKGGKKGKGKNNQKDGKAESSIPRFDLHRIWPAKAISTWQILEKELEAGKEPSGSVVIVENIDKMAEYQSLAAAHSLKRSVILVTKAGEEEPKNVNNPKVVWLPYLSNLALARAAVATTTGEPADVQGMEPIKKDKSGPPPEDLTTLRIVVDLWLIEEEKKRDYLREHPHASLHEMAKGKLKEIKTHGWVIGEHVISGYCSLGAKEANIVLSMSGTSGVFTSRLRQDVAAQPPVTWIKVEEKESTSNYYRRVQQLAAESNVAIARRAGGGAFLGILKEDDSDRNRAWQVSGIPSFWGPQSVKAWLQECGWTVENAMRPPNGKFKTWAFQGRCEGHGKQSQFAYELPYGEKVHHITINHWQKKRVPTKEEAEKEQKLRGSRWWSADDTDPIEAMELSPTLKFETAIADTAMDEESQDNNGKRTSTPEKAMVGSKKKKVDAPKPVLKGGSMGPEGSSLIDLGGSGECGWRALSCMIALHNSPHKDLDAITEKVEVLATTLRAKTVSYLVQHRTRWQDSWVPDPAANSTTEAGEPAANLESFISTVLKREKRWVCGLCLAGVSLLQGCTIVVWQYVGNAEQTHLREFWRRAAIIKGKESQKPIVIPVVLHYGHYYGLRYPALRRSWPKEWALSKEDEDITLTQNVDDTQKLTALSRGGEHEKQDGKGLTVDALGSTEDVSWDINLSGICRGGGGSCFETPKKRKKEEAEDLLRTFSSRRTKASSGKEDLLRTFSTKRSKASAKGCEDIETMLRVCEQEQLPSTTRKEKSKIWSCPICQDEFKIGDRVKAAKMITNHLRRLHYGIYLNAMVKNSLRNRHGAGLGMTGLVQPVPFIKMDEKDRASQAEFVCPYCDMALPLLAEGRCGRKVSRKKLNDSKGLTTTRRYLQRLSKKQHLRCDCEYRHEKKDVTMRQYHSDYIKKVTSLTKNGF